MLERNSNKLTLNVSKSDFIIIHPPKKKRNRQVTIKINGENLEEESHTKYLAVLIDRNLNWKAHIHHINLKLAKGLGMIAKIRHFIPSLSSETFTMPLFILTLIIPFLIGVVQRLLTLSL